MCQVNNNVLMSTRVDFLLPEPNKSPLLIMIHGELKLQTDQSSMAHRQSLCSPSRWHHLL